MSSQLKKLENALELLESALIESQKGSEYALPGTIDTVYSELKNIVETEKHINSLI